MAWPKGKSTTGTAAVRNETEIEADRLFLLALLQRSGPDVTAVDVAKVLNDRRTAAAREAALLTGASNDEAAAAAENATVSVQTVRRDIRIVLERLRTGTAAAGAALLDDQIAEVRLDMERVDRVIDEAWVDIQRSRDRQWSRTEGRRGSGANAEIRPDRLVRHKEDAAASASLYNVILRALRRLEALRRELRTLRWGREFLGGEEQQSFTQAVTNLSDPEQARDAALSLYAQHLEWLLRADSMAEAPTSPELARMQQVRTQKLVSRARMLREFIPLAEPNGGRSGFEIRVKRISGPADEVPS